MSKVALSGNASGTGTFTIASPNSNSDRIINLPDAAGTVAVTGGQPSFVSTIGVGNATPSASGAGITFPATQSASSDANTLDDYEEGTFTPSITGTTTAGVGTYQTRAGRYVKVGRLVTVNMTLQWNAHTGTGGMVVTGLPFTADGAAGVSIRSDAIGMNANSYMTNSIEDGTTYILMVQTVTGTTNGLNVSMDSAGFLIVGASYIAIA